MMDIPSLRPLHPHQQRAIDELWRSVIGYEGRYEVSSLGRIRALPRQILKKSNIRGSYLYNVPARIMREYTAGGYARVFLRRDDNGTGRLVHQLVAEAFIGPRPIGHFVCHNDGNRRNNRSDNLRYDTPRNNSADMAIHGTLLIGQKNHLAKLNPEAVREIRAVKGTRTQRELAAQFGVSRSAIGYVQSRKVWRHIDD